MKKIFLISFPVTLAVVLYSCIFSISKRLIQEIDFKNLTGGMVSITVQNPADAVSLMDGKSIVLDVSNTDFVKISFSDPNYFFKYNLSDLDKNVTTDNEKSGKCIWGHVHWVYSCTINKNKSLVFKRDDQNNELKDFILRPVARKN